MTLVSRNDLGWYAARLAIAVHETRRLTPEMSVLDLRSALQGIEGSESLTVSYARSGNQIIHLGDKELEVGPMASNAEIRAALLNPFVRTENTKMSISGYEPGAIKARLEALKKAGKDRRDQAIAKLDEAGKKHEAVSEEIERVAATIEKEADAALQEFSEFSNGGPT
jgi:hypothetical protein